MRVDLKHAGRQTLDFFLPASPGVRLASPSSPSRIASPKRRRDRIILSVDPLFKEAQRLESKLSELELAISSARSECQDLFQKQCDAGSTLSKMKWCEKGAEEQNFHAGLLLEKLIAENVRTLVKNLPPLSPIRPPLLKAILNGMDKKGAMDYFSLSERTFKRIQVGGQGDDLLVSIKFKLNTTRQRLDPRGMELLEELANMKVEQIILLYYYNYIIFFLVFIFYSNFHFLFKDLLVFFL